MMKLNNWSQFDDLSELETEQPPQVKRQRQKQRKWREIEDIKERQRMRRELVDYNVVDIDSELAAIFA